jgi:hypothetical protein
MAKISEDVIDELEALKAIYGNDFMDRPPVWNIPSFAISIQPTIDEGQTIVNVIGK